LRIKEKAERTRLDQQAKTFVKEAIELGEAGKPVWKPGGTLRDSNPSIETKDANSGDQNASTYKLVNRVKDRSAQAETPTRRSRQLQSRA